MPAINPVTISPLSNPPTTTDPANFDSRGDIFFSQLPPFADQLNSVASVTYSNAVLAANSADAAIAAASATSSAEGFAITATNKAAEALSYRNSAQTYRDEAQQFRDQAASYVGGVVTFNGQSGNVTYVAPVSTVQGKIGNVRLAYSELDSKPTTLSAAGIESAMPETTSNGQNIELSNTNQIHLCTYGAQAYRTLPSNPTPGREVWICFTNGRGDNAIFVGNAGKSLICPNGNFINAGEYLLADGLPHQLYGFIYLGTDNIWRLI